MSTRPTSDVSAVVWDFGNVLVRFEPWRAVAGAYSAAQWADFCRRADFDALNRRCDAGATRAAGAAELEEMDPWLAEVYRSYAQNIAKALPGPVPGTAELVHALAARGVPQYGLTNWPADDFHLAAVRAPATTLMRGVVVSGHEGVAKPDPRIYRILLERYGPDPRLTLFVDDSPANVAAARDLGFAGVLFTGASDLGVILTGLGLLAAP